jgi:hypothetical protein
MPIYQKHIGSWKTFQESLGNNMEAFDKEWQIKVAELVENIKILESKFDWESALTINEKEKLKLLRQELNNLLFGYI